MTTEQQVKSVDNCHINGAVDQNINPTNDEIPTITTTTSPDVTGRHSRFFRTKRKQRLGETSTNINGQDSIEIPQTDITKPVEKSKSRSSSPPPPPPSLTKDESDESDDDTPSIDSRKIPKIIITQSKQSIVNVTPNYQLKKSHSVKLTGIDQNDSGPKKAVRFADDFGLDLSQVKVIKTDELPLVPTAAFKHLHVEDDYNSSTKTRESIKTITYMDPQFSNPIHNPDFNDRVSRLKVILEQANAIDNRIYGTIKLVSLSLHKRVRVRFTTDNWITSKDYDATYIPNSHDGIHDRFSFMIDIDRYRICAGNNIQFCISYESFVGPEYWDNNYNQNYRFDCFTRAIPDYSV